MRTQNYKQDDDYKEALKLQNHNEPQLDKAKPVKYQLNAYDFNSYDDAINLDPEDGCITSYIKCARNIYGYIKQEFVANEFYECLYNLTGCGHSILNLYRQGYDEAGEPIYYADTLGSTCFDYNF